jgi:hypothetical protein
MNTDITQQGSAQKIDDTGEDYLPLRQIAKQDFDCVAKGSTHCPASKN